MSQNHEGYEQAMRDVFSILDAHRALGGMSQRHEDSLEAIRIALETLRRNNLRYAEEREAARGH